MNQPAARLLLFSRAGFEPDLVTEADRARDVELVPWWPCKAQISPRPSGSVRLFK